MKGLAPCLKSYDLRAKWSKNGIWINNNINLEIVTNVVSLEGGKYYIKTWLLILEQCSKDWKASDYNWYRYLLGQRNGHGIPFRKKPVGTMQLVCVTVEGS